MNVLALPNMVRRTTPYRASRWLPWFAALALLFTVPFWLSHLDIRAASAFYVPVPFDAPRTLAWPLAHRPVFKWLFRLGSDVSLLSLLAGAAAMAVPKLRRNALLRRCVSVLLLTLLLGPGLLVNGVGKDFTGRPRPRTIAEFGGYSTYLPPLDLGRPGTGKSFPCGHCSSGFAVGAVGLELLEVERVAGIATIVFSLLLGSAIGVARMADGAHFFSDVLWSGLLTWLAAIGAKGLLTWWARRGAELSARKRWLAPVAMVAVALSLIGGLLLARPFHSDVQASLGSDASVQRIALDLDAADLEIRIDPHLPQSMRLSGEVKGFGVPNLRIDESIAQTAGQWLLRVHRHGMASEVEAPLMLRVRPDVLRKLDIRIHQGSAVLLPAPGAHLQPLALDAQQRVVFPVR